MVPEGVQQRRRDVRRQIERGDVDLGRIRRADDAEVLSMRGAGPDAGSGDRRAAVRRLASARLLLRDKRDVLTGPKKRIRPSAFARGVVT